MVLHQVSILSPCFRGTRQNTAGGGILKSLANHRLISLCIHQSIGLGRVAELDLDNPVCVWVAVHKFGAVVQGLIHFNNNTANG